MGYFCLVGLLLFVCFRGGGKRAVCLPVLLQGHQEPDELAAHSPSFWHLDQLPFALAGAQHPAGSPDSAGWPLHAVLCCHCKPGEDRSNSMKKRQGHKVQDTCGATLVHIPYHICILEKSSYLCIDKREAVGQLQKETNELQVRFFCCQM